MKPKNIYLAKLQAQKAAEMHEARRFTMQQYHDMSMIALHLEFGFGPERLRQYNEAVWKIWDEYADICLADKDQEMVETHEKVDRALREACGKYFEPWEERYK